ncbi:MAG: DUF2007 domain-containing protein [bacterium]
MKRVYSSSYIADCDQLRVSLSLAGIESMMKNEFGNPVGLVLTGGAAAFVEPEVWVDDSDYEEAMKIVEEARKAARESDRAVLESDTDNLSGWQCPKCGENIEGTMYACWKCETARPFV